jgi:rod shape determining protein RodA
MAYMIDRRLVQNFDWLTVALVGAIVCVGLMSLYSAVFPQIQAHPTHNPFVKQLIWLTLGAGIIVAGFGFDYQQLRTAAPWLYLATIALLVVVLIFGKEINGSRRWLSLLGFRFQPSELMKIVIVVQLAAYFSSQEMTAYPSGSKLVPALAITGLPVVLILVEPDLGTALTVAAIAFTVIFFAGIRWRYIAAFLGASAASLWPVWNYVLKPYQKERILICLRPDLDPLGAGYHIRQSKIAIGSGKVWGKGFLEGTQNKLHFLPEKHTDFIFSVWAEEWGFVGSVAVLVLFGLLIYSLLRVARRSKDRFGLLLAVGMAGLIFWQVLVNIGMVIGLLPVVGITLPFVSYGGSSLLTLCLAIGIVENVSMRRYVFRSR